MREVMKRHEEVAFYGVPFANSELGYKFCRMRGFSELSTSKNPKEYTRQYVDEAFEHTDVVAYSPSMTFNLDRMIDDEVHADIVAIFNNEKMASAATRPIVIVDMSSEEKMARMREFSVVAEGEGSGTDAYVYSGTFKTNGETIFGTASSVDNWETLTFTPLD